MATTTIEIEVMDDITVLDIEAKLTALPLQFQHAIQMADALNLVVILGYAKEEEKVYLATVPQRYEQDVETE